MASTINYSLGENLLTADQCITSMTYKVIGEPIRISDGDWHGKLNELGELFNKNNLKKMIKKGVHAAVLGAALATGTAMVGCKQPEDPTIEDPNNNPGGNGQGGIQQPEDDLIGEAAPYDRNLSNGYVIHNFFGQNPKFQPKTMVNDVNKYLGKAETYIKGLVDEFNQSLDNRPAAKAYFKPYINALKDNNYYNVDKYDAPYSNIDPLIVINSRNGNYIFEDIIRNLDNSPERLDFYYAYSTLATEAFREGYGKDFNSYPDVPTLYKRNRENVAYYWDCGFDLDNDIDNNNCQQVVNKLHTMATKAANNMGNDITADDLRRVVNLGLTANSMVSMHNVARYNLNHTACTAVIDVEYEMYKLAEKLWEEENNATQNQDLAR